MSKRTRKEEPPPEPVIMDRAIVEKEEVVTKWAMCGEDALKTMQEVQELIGRLSNDLEQSQREVAEIEGEANQLLSTRTEQVGATSTIARKGRKKQEQAESAGFVEVELSATESAIRGLEEKKRQKVINALTMLFSLPAPLTDRSNNNSQGASPECTMNASPIGVVQLLGAEELHSALPGQSTVSHPNSHVTTSNEPRRPRDVPAVLWEEMASLRLRRIAAEERLKAIYTEVQRQMKRFKILQAMYEMSIYSCRNAKTTLSKATETWHANYRKSICAATHEGKSGR